MKPESLDFLGFPFFVSSDNLFEPESDKLVDPHISVPGKHGIKIEEEKENTPAPPAPAFWHGYSFFSSVHETTHLRRFLGFSVLDGDYSVHEKSPEPRKIAVQGLRLFLGFYSSFRGVQLPPQDQRKRNFQDQ